MTQRDKNLWNLFKNTQSTALKRLRRPERGLRDHEIAQQASGVFRFLVILLGSGVARELLK